MVVGEDRGHTNGWRLSLTLYWSPVVESTQSTIFHLNLSCLAGCPRVSISIVLKMTQSRASSMNYYPPIVRDSYLQQPQWYYYILGIHPPRAVTAPHAPSGCIRRLPQRQRQRKEQSHCSAHFGPVQTWCLFPVPGHWEPISAHSFLLVPEH